MLDMVCLVCSNLPISLPGRHPKPLSPCGCMVWCHFRTTTIPEEALLFANFGQPCTDLFKGFEGNVKILLLVGIEQRRMQAFVGWSNSGIKVLLIVGHGNFVDPLAEVQVGNMQKFHQTGQRSALFRLSFLPQCIEPKLINAAFNAYSERSFLENIQFFLLVRKKILTFFKNILIYIHLDLNFLLV